MLKVGGVVAIDDANFPAIRKVCRFVKTNWAYSVMAVEDPDPEPQLSFKRRLMERFLCRTSIRKLLRPEVVLPDETMGLAGRCVAFRKHADDGRGWDHFVDF